mgnify:FL=1|tara:strand:- start:2950 stop:3588 length:639 start_codon:yes stop_codon:yes gene_type:complete
MSILVHQLALGTMDNFVYVIEDEVSKACTIVDPAWDVSAILACIQSRDLELVYILLTHGHFDHTDGLVDCLAYKDVPVYMSKQELPKLIPNQPNMIFTNDNDIIPFGSNHIKIIHTPGHSPGGQCFYIDNHLITGDTLFINGCGRCDLGGSSLDDMYNSLETIKLLPDETIIYPGHDYDDKPIDTLTNQKKTNRFLLCQNKEEFIRKRDRKK